MRAPEHPHLARRRALRVALGVLGVLVVVMALAVGAVTWLVSTGSGARFALDRLDPLVPGELSLGKVEGPLRGPLHIEDLVYTREGMRVAIRDVMLRWHLRDLLHRQLDIHSLVASGVRLETQPVEDEASVPFELPQLELPVNVIVREARVEDAVLAIGEGEPIVIRSATLSTSSTRGEEVRIESFDVDSPDLALEVSGSLEPVGDYPVDLDLSWALAAPDGKLYRGAGSLDGTLEDLVVVQRLTEPFEASVDARLLRPLDDLRVDGTLETPGITLTDIDPAWPVARVRGRLRAQGSLEDLRVEGSVVADTADYGRVDADLAVRGGGERWTIERLRLAPASSGAVLHASGDVTLGATPRFDLEARWDGLRWPLQPQQPAVALAPSGSVRLAGTADSYQLEGQARLGLPGLAAAVPATSVTPRTDVLEADVAAGSPPAAIERAPLWIDAEISGTGDRSGMDVARFVGRTLGGRITGKGAFAWQPAVTWQLAVTGDSLEPAVLDPRIDGSLDLALETRGRMEESGPRGTVELQRLAGTLRGSPVRGQGRIDLAGETYRIPALGVTWGKSSLKASGVVSDTLDLRFTLDAPELQALLPDLNGAVHAEGKVTGARASPGLEATLRGERLLVAGISAASLSANVRVGQSPDDPLLLDLEAAELRYGEYRFAGASLEAKGTREAHTLTAALVDGARPLESLEIGARGGLAGAAQGETEWRGEATRVVFVPDEKHTWTLRSPAPIVAGPGRVSLEQLCLRSEGSTLCATAAMRGADWQLEATADAVALDRLASLYRDDIAVEGTVGGTLAAASMPGGRIRATADLVSPRGTFAAPLETGEGSAPSEWRDARIRLRAGERGTRADAAVTLVDMGNVSGWLELPGFASLGMPPDAQQVRGAVQAAASSLEPLALVSDAFARPRGSLDADLQIGGTVGVPRIAGSAKLRDGSAFVVPLGIEVTDVQITATPDEAGRLGIEGSLQSGEGILYVRGDAPLDAKDVLVRVELSGEDVLVMDLHDRHVVATTDELGVVWGAQGLAVNGEVRIPEALLELGEENPDAVTASTDVVFVRLPPGEGREVTDEMELFARVRVILGEEVRVTGLGLDAQVRGSLLVVETPGSETIATGELDLSGGQFAAYGQKLELERGRLIFASSPVTSPAIDLRASRRTGEIVAGIDARGTLQAPRVTLWSEPPMPQAEQLSYLLLGRPLNDASAEDGQVLASAARSLGLRGGRWLAGRIGSTFGLEEARIDTEGGFEEASLVLGKFLSPRLYVSYGVGLFDEANTLLVRYLLSKKLTLEAATGEDNRADVLYVIETGPGEARPHLEPRLPDFEADRDPPRSASDPQP